MIEKLKVLYAAYIAARERLGLHSDRELMDAWARNPEAFRDILEIRMYLISAIKRLNALS